MDFTLLVSAYRCHWGMFASRVTRDVFAHFEYFELHICGPVKRFMQYRSPCSCLRVTPPTRHIYAVKYNSMLLNMALHMLLLSARITL